METMFGSESAFNPAVLLAMWSAGIAGAGALVAYWRIVGPGYLWLTAGTIGLVGGMAWFFDPGPVVALACLVVIGAVPVARRSGIAAVMFGVAAVLFLAGAAVGDRLVPAVTGSLALGGITAELLLGHWYLVSPRIPRRPLQRLAAAGAVGVALDAAVVLSFGYPHAGSATALVVSVGLAGTSFLLMVAVWFALRYPSYPGVMAATGLGYLAVLTSLGSVTLARAVAMGVAPLR